MVGGGGGGLCRGLGRVLKRRRRKRAKKSVDLWGFQVVAMSIGPEYKGAVAVRTRWG